MRVSRADLAGAAALFLLSASTAIAQIGPPVQLVPAPAAPPAAAASPATPAPPAMPASPSSDEDIQAAPLAPMDPSWIGTLGPADGAFPHEMWGATPRAIVAAALPLLQPTTSPTLQNLDRRLLLSDATAPAGQDAPNLPSLIERRVDRLLALGRLDGVSLFDALPQANASETIDRDNVELRFAANDVDGACHLVQQRVALYPNPWWNRAIIACQALSGSYDQAMIGLSAMRERKIAADPVFDALVDTIAGQRQKLEKLPDPTPMRVALWAAAKLPAPADLLADAGPAALATWATSDKVPALEKLAAGEKAEALGALTPDALGLLYAGVEAKPEEQAALVKSGKLPNDPRSRALLYNTARADAAPATRIAALTPLLADARRRDAFVPMARLVAPLVVELQPDQAAQGFAADAARVLLATAQFDRAAPWIDLANAPELRMIAALAQPGASDQPPLLAAAAALMARDAKAAPHQIGLMMALLTALGGATGDVDLAPFFASAHSGQVPAMTVWLDQEQAVAGKRFGEAVLTSVILGSAGDRLSPEPIVLAHVVGGLKAMGLEAEARALAVEAALAAGI